MTPQRREQMMGEVFFKGPGQWDLIIEGLVNDRFLDFTAEHKGKKYQFSSRICGLEPINHRLHIWRVYLYPRKNDRQDQVPRELAEVLFSGSADVKIFYDADNRNGSFLRERIVSD